MQRQRRKRLSKVVQEYEVECCFIRPCERWQLFERDLVVHGVEMKTSGAHRGGNAN